METKPLSLTKRELIFHDVLTFLGLTMVTVLLFFITFFLFRSFSERRAELGKSWSDQGRAALQANQPERAVQSLRTALSYAPGERSYELLLAQALTEAGHTDEATNYFTSLWDTEPGDGFINLQLARLAVKKQEKQPAIDFYRAAIDGKWEINGAVRRRDVRLELARYLVQQHDDQPARVELLLIGGDVPNDPALDIELARLLQQANDPADALQSYERAIAASPQNDTALTEAGRLAFSMSEFATAHRLLQRSMQESADKSQAGSDALLLEQSERILLLMPSEKLATAEKVRRILAARAIAKRRLDDCAKAPGALPPALDPLAARWLSSEGTSSRSVLLADAASQDAAMQLVYDTEIQTNQVCGAAAGDDALLLLLAQSQKTADR